MITQVAMLLNGSVIGWNAALLVYGHGGPWPWLVVWLGVVGAAVAWLDR